MKKALRKEFNKKNLVLIGLPIVLWLVVRAASYKDLHDPFFIFVFFIITTLGIGIFQVASEPTPEEKIEDAYKTVIACEKLKEYVEKEDTKAK